MPIEIRELYIKAVVDASAEKGKTGANTSPPRETPEEGEAHAEQLVDTCVQKIMEILRDKMER